MKKLINLTKIAVACSLFLLAPKGYSNDHSDHRNHKINHSSQLQKQGTSKTDEKLRHSSKPNLVPTAAQMNSKSSHHHAPRRQVQHRRHNNHKVQHHNRHSRPPNHRQHHGNSHAGKHKKHHKSHKHRGHRGHGHGHGHHHKNEYELSLLRVIYENKSAQKLEEEAEGEGRETGPPPIETGFDNPFAFAKQSKIGVGGRLNVEYKHHWTGFIGANITQTTLQGDSLTNEFTDYELSGGVSYTFNKMGARFFPYSILEVGQVKKTNLVAKDIFEIEKGVEYAVGIGLKTKLSGRIFLEIENKIIKKFLFGEIQEVKNEVDETGRVVQIVEGRVSESNLDLDSVVDFSNTTIGFGVKL